MRSCKSCRHTLGSGYCFGCNRSSGFHKWEPKPMTNGDCIRSMTDAELAEFLETVNSCSCSFVMGKSPCVADGCPCWFEWLREEVSE